MKIQYVLHIVVIDHLDLLPVLHIVRYEHYFIHYTDNVPMKNSLS